MVSGHQRHNLSKVQLTLLRTTKQQTVKTVCKISKIIQLEWFGAIAFTAIRVETDHRDGRTLIVNYFFSLSQSMPFTFVYCKGTVNNARFFVKYKCSSVVVGVFFPSSVRIGRISCW